MFNYMGCNEEMVEEGVKKYGLAVGARKMIDLEYQSAAEALETGVYITYNNALKKSECTRVGKKSKCYCGHPLGSHSSQYFGKKCNTACGECPCKRYAFVPTRPEQCGMYWLVRRKDFNVSTWAPPCKCKHTNLEHACNPPFRCKSCQCYGFTSNFACLTCDGSWEDHETIYETVDERRALKKPIGEAYLPLASHPAIQQQVFNRPQDKLIRGVSVPPPKMVKENQARSKNLNPTRPSKEQQAKLKSPLGIVLRPKYPDFMYKK